MNVLTEQPTTDGKRLRGKLLSERATNLRNGQQMNYGTGDSLTSRSLALWAEFLEDLAAPGLSKKQTESKPVRDTSKITGERSRSGVPSFGIHNEYFTIKDYFKSDDDRHYQKRFGDKWTANGKTFSLYYISSVGEFICVNNDKNYRPNVFELEAYCATGEEATDALNGWLNLQDTPNGLRQVLDFIERKFPR